MLEWQHPMCLLYHFLPSAKHRILDIGALNKYLLSVNDYAYLSNKYLGNQDTFM